MNRRAFVASGLALSVAPGAVWAAGAAGDDGYSVSVESGTLFGTALVQAVRRAPAVLIIGGSGPTDRDGNSPLGLKTDAYKQIAEALFARGVASVRYDKRGVGASYNALLDESKARFEDVIADASSWIAKMRSDARFGPITVAGHSEGSLIGMLAAYRAQADAFVSLEGPGFPAAEGLRRQTHVALAAMPDLEAANDRILDALTRGETVADVPDALAPLYRASVQPYMIGYFRYDPRIEVAQLTCPVTIVQGTADFQVLVDDANALAAAIPAARLDIVDGLTHPLKHVDDPSRANQLATVYADPSIPLDPAVTDAIEAAAWPRER